MCEGCNCYFSFWAIFCPFTPLTARKTKIEKKMPGDIIILHKCTKNHDHMLYCSLDMARDRCNCHFCLSFAFLPIPPPRPPPPNSPQKTRFLKNEKKTHEDIIILHMCTKNYHQMMYGT